MREDYIVVHPFEEMKVEEYQGVQQLNEHAAVNLAGYIPFRKKEEYLQAAREQEWVQVAAVAQDGSESTLFCGIVEKMEMKVKGGTCRMEIVLRSGTVRMDANKRTRSFQNTDMLYSDVLDICRQGYSNAEKIMTAAKGEKIGQFIMQYRETDWEFVKRLAGMKHTVLVADCSTCGEKYYFGLPDRQNIMQGDSMEYSACYDLEARREANDSQGAAMSYIWESREIYRLGDCGIIDGHTMFVWKIESRMKGNTLSHVYHMLLKAGYQVPLRYNSQLSGASLFGVIQGVDGEKIWMEITEDGNKGKTGVYWFPYATPYSSQDGTGWYCMPENGDKVRLYFPTEKERDAYAVSAYHEGEAVLRTEPKRKFWRNKEGKEIQLSPDKILLTNNDGTYVELSDQKGVEIVSEGSVTLSAGGSLRISSTNASIELSAPNKIRLKQGETEMNLGGDLNMSGAQIKL